MAAPSSSSIIRIPSTLVWNTSTTLGECRAIEFTPNVKLRPIWAEEAGSVTDVIHGGEEVIIKAVLRYPDADAIAAICANGSSSNFSFTPFGGTRSSGLSLYTKAGTLKITPKYSSHQALTLYKAIPSVSETAMLMYAWNKEYGLEVVFYGSIDGSGRVYATS